MGTLARGRGTAAVATAILMLGGLAGLASAQAPTSGAGAPTTHGSPVPTGLAWTSRSSMPTERLEMAAATVDGKPHIVGGLSADGEALATVEVYDPVTDTWSSGSDHPVPVHHPMAAVLDGMLYVAGGYGPAGAATRRVHRLGAEGWEAVARLPLARAAGTMAALDGRLLLAGGIDLGGRIAREMLVYDSAADTWAVEAGPPTPREHLGGAIVGGRFLTVGGRISGAQVGNVEAWDPMTGAWETLPDLPTPRAGLGVTATCDGGLVAVGGEDIRGIEDRTFAAVEAWDPASGTWGRLPDLPAGRHGVGVTAVGSTILVIGGGTEPGLSASDSVEVLDMVGLAGCAGHAAPP